MIRQMGQTAPPESRAVNSNQENPNSIDFEDLEDSDDREDWRSDGLIVPAVQISARNVLRAKVKRIVRGTVNAEVTLTIAPDVELVSIVTRTSADSLGLRKGKEVYAVIKSSSVMIAAGQ